MSVHLIYARASQIDLQIAKQGYRMANWFNTIFESHASDFRVPDISEKWSYYQMALN